MENLRRIQEKPKWIDDGCMGRMMDTLGVSRD
jgi:hypothetical protein